MENAGAMDRLARHDTSPVKSRMFAEMKTPAPAQCFATSIVNQRLKIARNSAKSAADS
jgi:hypothetical protein